jgi:hypothetical protein
MELDQHIIDSHVALVLVTLPLPPLPVVVSKGDNCECATCSSHDLHAVMLRTQMHMLHTEAFSDTEHMKRMEAKNDAITCLYKGIKDTLQKHETLDDAATAECYTHLCSAFRAYTSGYAHSCRDIRILPISDVVCGDSVHRQACAYVAAVMDTHDEMSNRSLSYTFLLQKWLLYMHAQL